MECDGKAGLGLVGRSGRVPFIIIHLGWLAVVEMSGGNERKGKEFGLAVDPSAHHPPPHSPAQPSPVRQRQPMSWLRDADN